MRCYRFLELDDINNQPHAQASNQGWATANFEGAYVCYCRFYKRCKTEASIVDVGARLCLMRLEFDLCVWPLPPSVCFFQCLFFLFSSPLRSQYLTLKIHLSLIVLSSQCPTLLISPPLSVFSSQTSISPPLISSSPMSFPLNVFSSQCSSLSIYFSLNILPSQCPPFSV